MGVFTIDYETRIVPELYRAIDNALENEVKDTALQALEFSAMHSIYMAYTPEPFFQESRRYSFMQDESYETEVSDNKLTIKAVVYPQNLFSRIGSTKWATADLGDVVAKGDVSWMQPFERPWMDEGIEANMAQIEAALKRGLERQGF